MQDHSMESTQNKNPTTGEQLILERLEVLSRLITVSMVRKDFSELNQDNQIKVLFKHGLKNKDISSLLGIKQPNVSRSLKKK